MLNKKKEYIRDGKQVRNCPSNVSKMNIFEWIYYDFKYWNELRNIKYHFCTSLKYILLGVTDLLCVLLLPISILVNSILAISQAKKTVADNEKRQRNRENVV